MSLEQTSAPDPSGAGVEPPVEPQRASVSPERWLEEHGDVLFNFAVTRVRDTATAQDLVQETFLAALKARAGFGGRSTIRAWLFGILRNKLTDYYRRQSREVSLEEPDCTLGEEAFFEQRGLGKDGWVGRFAPKPWETPDESLVNKEFQEVFARCLSGLPLKVAQVFVRREADGVASEEICKEFGLSPNNLWVMLHRARLSLRRCLEAHWFGHKAPPPPAHPATPPKN